MGNACRVSAPACAAALVSVLVLAPTVSRGAEKTVRADLPGCAGFTAADAAPFLGVPAERVVAKAEKVHASLWTCSYAGGPGGKTVAFSVEVARDPKAAAAAMEQYRADLEIAAETAPFKDRLPKGAWSEILGEGFGDENVWTDVNGAFTARKGAVTVQVTLPGEKIEKIRVAQAVLAKLP